MKNNDSIEWGDINLSLKEIDKLEEWTKLSAKLGKRKRKKRFLLIIWFGIGLFGLMTIAKLNKPQNYQISDNTFQNANIKANQSNFKSDHSINLHLNKIDHSDSKITNLKKENNGANKLNRKRNNSNFKKQSRLINLLPFCDDNLKHKLETPHMNYTLMNKRNSQTTNINLNINQSITNNQEILETNLIESKPNISTIILSHNNENKDLDFQNTNRLMINKFNSKWIDHVELNIGYGVSSYQQHNKNSNSNDYSNRRKMIEKGFDAIEAEILISKKIKFNSKLALGFSARMNHFKTKEGGYLESNELLRDQITEINKNGDIIKEEIHGEIEGKVIRSYNTQFYNRYLSLSIPITISKQFTIKYLGNYHIETGLLLGIYSDIKGYLPSDVKRYKFENINKSINRRRVFDAYRFKLSKTIWLKNSIHLNPYISYTHDIQDRLNHPSISQFNYQLNFGISIKLNK
ncbi:MAG: hypothetical protein IT265_00250 [Saprospiraceae bacterium]|nr:hypothetical protein [Saprospiraceae bacterium]